MGRVAKLLSFVRGLRNGANVSDAKVDRGGSDIRTLEHFSAPGDDSHPLPGDYVAAIPQAGTGRDSAVGYLDPVNAPVAQPGEKRIYGRDGDGVFAGNEIRLKPNGDIAIVGPIATLTLSALGSVKGENDNGSFELTPAGAFVVNGAIIGTDGNLITATGINSDTHTHVGNLGSPTSPPIP